MANLEVKDYNTNEKHLAATGAGSDVDPHILIHEAIQATAADLNVTEASAASILTAAQAIQTAVELIDNMISGSEAQVDVVSSALPTGAATEATLAAIQTAVELIDNAIAGAEMQVDVVGSLPAGDNNIGNVDVVSSALPTGAATEATLAAIQTAVELIDNMISGSEAQVDVVSSALPTGAATAANQLPDGHNVTVDNASGAPIPVEIGDGTNQVGVDGSGHLQVDIAADSIGIGGGTQYDEGTVDASITGNAMLAEAPSDTLEPLQLNASNHLKVDISTDSVGIGGGTQYTEDAAAPADPVGNALMLTRDDTITTLSEAEDDWTRGRATAEGALWTQDFNSDAILAALGAIETAVEIIDNMIAGSEAQVDVVSSALPTGAATEATLAAIQTAVELIDNMISGSEAQVDVVSSALPTGAATESTLGDIKTAVEIIDNMISGNEAQVDVVAALPAGTNMIGEAGIAGVTTSNGLTEWKSIDLDESEEQVKGSAGRLYGIYIYNLATAKRYIKFYDNTAAGVTVGTTTPDMTFPLEADQGAVLDFGPGIYCATGITFAATTGIADNDSGAPGANEVAINVWYK